MKNIDNLILEHLKKIQTEQIASRERDSEIMARLAQVESSVATMQITIATPEVGKTYQSTKFPGFFVQVASVEPHLTDGFFAHAVDKSAGGDNQYIGLFGAEWKHGEFTLAPEPCKH